VSLQARVVHAAAGLGIEEANRPELVDFGGSNLANENVRQDKRGGLTKRRGFGTLTTTTLDGGSLSTGKALVTLGKTLSAVDSDGNLRTYSPAADRWVAQNRAPECMPSRLPMPFAGGIPTAADAVHANGYIVSVAFSLNLSTVAEYNLTATVYDADESTVVRTDVFSVGGPDAGLFRLAATGSTVLLVYSDTTDVGANDFAMLTLSVASAASINTGWSARVDSGVGNAALGTTAGTIDAVGTASEFIVSYVGTGNTIRTIRYNTSLVSQETLSTNSGAPATAVAITYDGSASLWIAFAVGTAGWLLQVSATSLATSTGSALNLITAGASIDKMGIASLSSTSARLLVYSGNGAAGAQHTYARSATIAAGFVTASGATRTAFRLSPVSRPWVYGSAVYVAMVPVGNASEENDDQMLFICDQTSDTGTTRVAAIVAPRQVVVRPFTFVGGGVAVSTGKYIVPFASQRSSLVSTTGAAFELALLDFTDTRRFRSSEFAECAYMAGGVASFFDGSRVDEAAFLVRPDPPVATVTATAGNPNTAGLRYIAIYQKTDSRGNVHWSAPSDPSNSVSPTSDRVNIVCTTLQLTQHHDASDTYNPARIVLYRSGANGALPYQRVTGDNISSNTIADVRNNYAASTMTLVDDEADTTANASLYRQPGQVGTELQHQCPPACSLLYPYAGMLVGVADDGITLWYSAYRIPGEGVWWNDVFQLPIAEEGAITALAAMDGALFVFKRGAIFALAGSSPSGNGSDGGLGEYRRLACDVGCVDPRSVVVTSFGVFFQSERGIELLTRAQSVEWVGEPVQATLASFPVIVSATLDAADSVVRFECVASETLGDVSSTGVQLVYDLSLKQWVSVDKVTGSGNASRSAQCAGMAYVSGGFKYCRLDSTGTLYYERAASDASAHLDTNQWVTALYETGNLKTGILQEQRVFNGQILFEQHSAAGLKIETAYDFGAYSAADDKTWAEAATLSQTKLEMRPKALRHAVRFRVSDTQPAVVGTGKGFTFVGMSFDMAAKQGSTKGTPRIDTALRR
jgi:hypothetical protein